MNDYLKCSSFTISVYSPMNVVYYEETLVIPHVTIGSSDSQLPHSNLGAPMQRHSVSYSPHMITCL